MVDCIGVMWSASIVIYLLNPVVPYVCPAFRLSTVNRLTPRSRTRIQDPRTLFQ
jgi:hypothetical protein